MVPGRVAPRGMGAHVGNVHEKGPVPVAAQPFDCLLGHESCLGELGREPGGRPGRPVIVGPRIGGVRPVEVEWYRWHVDAVLGQPFPPLEGTLLVRVTYNGFEPGQHSLIAHGAGVAGRDSAGVGTGVGVAEKHRRITIFPGFQGDIGEPGIEGRAVHDRPVVLHVHACVKARPARPARGGVGPMVGEKYAPSGKGIDMRRAHHGVPRTGQAVAPPLVHGDEQDVSSHWRPFSFSKAS